MIGVGKRKQWDLMKYIAIIPFYWLMMSIAGAIAFYQLLFKPHYWEKTVHGFHLKKKFEELKVIQPIVQPVVRPAVVPVYVSPRQASIVSTNFMWQVLLFISVLAIDVTLANYFLPANEIETYWLLALIAKTGFFISQILAIFMANLFSKNKKSQSKFRALLFFTFLFNWINFVSLGLEGSQLVPFFGERFLSIIPYLPFYTLGLMSFALANVFATFYLKKERYAILSVLITISQFIFIYPHGEDIGSFIKMFAYLGTIDLIVMIALQANPHMITTVVRNITHLFRQRLPKTA
jgi:hypothetical protein